MLLLDAARAVEARVERDLSDMGLSLAKLGALRHLALADEPLTLTQLAERHCCGRSNVTALIDRLEADGLVERSGDPSNRRNVRASLTATGRDAYQRASEMLAEHERSFEERLGSAPRAELARGLRALREG
jgi:DNA-binding MarR family transcriptional regulator